MSSHAAAGPIRNALTPLAHSPRTRICNALSKTLGALHDARKEVRRRLLAVIFDGEPLRLRATGADLNWDDDDQTSEVRAAVTVDERGDDGVNTFQLSLALDGHFRPRELATCLQTVVEEAHTDSDWRRDLSTSTPHLENVVQHFLRLDECARECALEDDVKKTHCHWPIDLDRIQKIYPSIGEVLKHVHFAHVQVLRRGTDDVVWEHGIGSDRFECTFETVEADGRTRLRSRQGFVVPSLTDFAGETAVDIVISIKLRLLIGVLSLPELKFAFEHQSDGDDVHWKATLTDVGPATWGEFLLSAVLPFPALRRLLLETWCWKLNLVEEGLRLRVRSDVPRVGGCLVRLARAFIREKMGSALRLFADILGALDADFAAMRGEALPPPPRG